jgi:hypothetical protein
MTLFIHLIEVARVALLPLAAALLLEELTYGGLVRLLVAPRPGAGKSGEPNHQAGGGKCSR